MLWLLPEEVAALHRFWGQVEPDLGSLREPFDRHLTEPIGWIYAAGTTVGHVRASRRCARTLPLVWLRGPADTIDHYFGVCVPLITREKQSSMPSPAAAEAPALP
ncbi:hypothetical protein [Streptomyces coeruleorubidus]